MKHILKTCAAFFVATSLVFSLASCQSEDDDSSPVAVTSVELSDTTATITVGGTKTLTATVKPDNATDKTVTWTSSDETVATVANGVVAAVKVGEATITAKAGDKTATCAVTVSEAPTYSVTIAESTNGTVTASKTSGILQNETITLTVTPNSGYKLKTIGAKTGETDITVTDNTFVMPAGNVTVTATFEAESYSITLNVNGGAYAEGYIAPTSYAYGTGATLPTSENITKTNYILGGWFSSADFSGDAVTVISTTDSGNKEYWAKWTPFINLANVTEDTVVADGYTISGTLAAAVKVSIADGAIVTLSGASINADRELEGQSIAGLTCEGDATIIIADGSENTIRGIKKGYNVNGAGIFVPEGKTLTINGDTGILNAYGLGGAGIGANYNTNGGNVVITGGVITATGDTGIGCSDFADIGDITITGGTVTASSLSSSSHAGIGASSGRECGNILITGGTVTANGKNTAPGIGCGGVRNGQVGAKCGTITIADTVTKITATKGDNGTHGIGLDTGSSCGTITIGGTVFWDGSAYQNDGETVLAASPFSYPKIVDLSTITEDTTVEDGYTITGTLAENYKITIADGATVTLKNASMTTGKGISCAGNATITLAAGSTNVVVQGGSDKAGICIPDGSLLVINGNGALTVSGKGGGAGIGGGYREDSGSVTIQSGNVTATGGDKGAGIGGGQNGKCGDITINGGTVVSTGGWGGAGIGGGVYMAGGQSVCGNIAINGGTVTATGGKCAAGIGGGYGNNNNYKSSCGTITIANTVAKVTATKGGSAPKSIGEGYYGTCGTVTIGGVEGAITESPYTYEPSSN